MPRGSHRVVSAGVRCSFESGHKQNDHALTLRAISGSMHRNSLFDHLVGAGEPRGAEGRERRDQLFSSRLSSLKKRQSVPCEMILLGVDLIMPDSCNRSA